LVVESCCQSKLINFGAEVGRLNVFPSKSASVWGNGGFLV